VTKLKPCQHCQNLFAPARPMQAVCSPKCAMAKVRQDRLIEREQTKRRKRDAMRLRDILAKAQEAFNAYIRTRDADKPCICCGKPFEPQKPGGSMDAGHYLARSIAPQHRFNEDNVFGQRKNCNRPGGTTRAAFRAGVIDRIGIERVEALEADNRVPKWTREQLFELIETYRAKTRELKKEAA